MDTLRPGGNYTPLNGAQPEILSPLSEADVRPFRNAPPVRPASRSRGRWAYAPATYALVGINCLVFVLMVLNHVSFTDPTAAALLHWGANNGIRVLAGQWWRLLSAAFVHIGFIHLATNMWCLWNLGLLGEPLLGPFGMIAVYVLSGIAGNLLSIALHPTIIGAGASGAVFGLAGVLILLLKSPLLPVPPSEIRGLRRSVILFALLNFAIGISTSVIGSGLQIDNMAHLGGFLCGLAMGVPLVPRIGAPRSMFEERRWIAVIGMSCFLALFAYFVLSLYRPLPPH